MVCHVIGQNRPNDVPPACGTAGEGKTMECAASMMRPGASFAWPMMENTYSRMDHLAVYFRSGSMVILKHLLHSKST
jgi:hypothetical protein